MFTEREWKPLHWQTCTAFISNSIIVMLTTGITYIPTSEVPIQLCNIHRYRSYAHSTYLRLCIVHHTLPNRDVYSIYQTDRDDQGTMCISAIVLVTRCMPSPMLTSPPLEHSSLDYLYPGMDCYQTGNPLAYRGMHMAAEVMLVMTALKPTLPL